MTAPTSPTLADGPTATQVTFHGEDGSATVWVDPAGHVLLTAEQVRFLADHLASFDRATATDQLARANEVAYMDKVRAEKAAGAS